MKRRDQREQLKMRLKTESSQENLFTLIWLDGKFQAFNFAMGSVDYGLSCVFPSALSDRDVAAVMKPLKSSNERS